MVSVQHVILVLLALLPAAALAADPSSLPAPDLKPGDSWVFDRAFERGTSGFLDRRVDLKIERVGADSMIVGIKPDGAPTAFEDHIVGSDWSQRRLINGEQTTIGRPLSFPLTIGKTWTGAFVDPTRHGLQTSTEHRETYKVTGWEDVTTPAGTFHTLKIEADDKVKAQFMAASGAIGGAVTTADGSTVVAHTDKSGPHTEYGEFFSTFYYAPEVKYWVKMVKEDFNSEGVRTQRETDVLTAFKPAS
jgi:hypothetical protein